ncbi:MAG: antitoxin VapB family protein [Promethearchaeota archaeon]
MPQKTISLPEEIYHKLKKRKGRNETFPELIERLLNEQKEKEKIGNIMDLAGAFGDDSDEWEQIENELYKDRLRPSSRKGSIFED